MQMILLRPQTKLFTEAAKYPRIGFEQAYFGREQDCAETLQELESSPCKREGFPDQLLRA